MKAPHAAVLFLSILVSATPLMGQNYKGSMTSSGPLGMVATPLVINLKINGSSITGFLGIGSTATNMPLRGTRTGIHCKVTASGAGGVVFTGTCTDGGFSGTCTIGTKTGNFSLTSDPFRPTPVPIQIPAPQPAPTPISAPLQKPELPAAPGADPQPGFYCGTFTNTTFQFTGYLEIRVDPGSAFSGEISVGQAISNTSRGTFGSGTFTGFRLGTSCGATDSGGLQFKGTCTAVSISANSYSIEGQSGSFRVKSEGCAQRR
jgi:hypothetical protein